MSTKDELKDETANGTKPVLDDDAVKLVSLFGYWHLHRKLNGKNYFGFSDLIPFSSDTKKNCDDYLDALETENYDFCDRFFIEY